MVMQFFRAQDVRKRDVELFGTPNFQHVFGAIAAGGFEFIDLEQDIRQTAKYLPLESVVITNNSTEDVDVKINGIQYAQVPAGVLLTILQAIRSVRVVNNDTGTVAAGTVTANFKTPPLGADEAALNAYRKRSR